MRQPLIDIPEHQHAAGLMDLLFKGRLIFNLLLQLLCHTSMLLTSASNNQLLRKHLYNLCICYACERLIIIILMPYKK